MRDRKRGNKDAIESIWHSRQSNPSLGINFNSAIRKANEVIDTNLASYNFKSEIRKSILDSVFSILGNGSDSVTTDDVLKYITHRQMVENTVNLSSIIRDVLARESGKKTGTLIEIIPGNFSLKEKSKQVLGAYIIKRFESLGFDISTRGTIGLDNGYSKDGIRNLHSYSRTEKYISLRNLIEKKEDNLINHFSNGNEIDLEKMDPRIEVVTSESWQNDLFRYATLLWSIPVSSGFGRRTRFLVWDKANKKLIGLFALGDPVFNLKCRDQWIGWNSLDRENRLYNVMDIFVLGAVPPYNQLLGGKLIAMLAASTEVRKVIRNKYKGKRTIINGAKKDPELALLTTASALGKSSIYDRIKYKDKLIYNLIGTSEGWGHFHFSNEIFEGIRKFISIEHPNEAEKYKFGQGPNWKIRTIRQGLKDLGLNEDLLKHGIKREIYAVPLADNFREFLIDEDKTLRGIDLRVKEISTYFKERWLLSRADRKPEFRDFDKRDIWRIIRENGGVKHN